MDRLTKRVGKGEAINIGDFDICEPFIKSGQCKTGMQSGFPRKWERHCNDTCALGLMIDRLAAYEDTDLTPEEIETMRAYKCLDEHERELLFEYRELGTVDELRALVAEENAERLQLSERVKLERIFQTWAQNWVDARDPKSVFVFLEGQKALYVERLRNLIKDGEPWKD